MCVLHSLKEHRIGTQCVVDVMQVVVGWCTEEGIHVIRLHLWSCLVVVR